MIEINPIELKGNWAQGYALDRHTVSSVFLGEDEYGHFHYDTTRSPLGELLYKFKYQNDLSVLTDILNAANYFLVHRWGINKDIDCIIPVPPSNLVRAIQPALVIASGISTSLGIPICEVSLEKKKATPELKSIVDYEKRKSVLENAFDIVEESLHNKTVLLVDDLYRSGATFHEIVKTIYNKGKADKVFVLTITKTRSTR